MIGEESRVALIDRVSQDRLLGKVIPVSEEVRIPTRPLPHSSAASQYDGQMPVNRFTVGAMYVLAVLPFLLFGWAWIRDHRQASKGLLLPTVSALLLLLAVVGDLKVMLLGPDYTNRLYITVGVNLLVAIVSTVYFGVKQKWIALLAALILALDWWIIGAINSVV